MESIGAPPSPRGSIFTPLLISMVGILATSLAIVAYHLLILKYCLRRQADPGQLLSAPRAPLSTGVDAEILETIPILSYSKGKGSIFLVDQSECAVCLAELQDDDMVRLLPSCRHVFHISCIDEWFVAHASSPVCLAPVTALVPLPDTAQDGDQGLHRPSPDQFQRGISNGSDLGKQLRHCGSCVLPMDVRPTPAMKEGLKRSLSMGQSYVIIETRTESERSPCSSSSPILGRSRSHKARSVRQIDRAPSSLRRSFSRLRMGLSGRSNQILPY